MGEDLVLYRDASGAYGLIDRHCPHRRADLSYGIVEECGLRCAYHGWLFDGTGRCLQQPFEEITRPEARFKDKIRITAYPVDAKAGLLWAYLGPAPAPLIPDWDLFHEHGLQADRVLGGALQLVPGAGELHRPRPLRVAALELVGGAARAGRATGAHPPQDRVRRVRVGLRLSPGARGHDRGRASSGRSAACVSGRTVSTRGSSSGVFPSTTSTRCTSPGSTRRCPGKNRSCRSASRTGTGPSGIPAAAAGSRRTS